MIGIVLASVAIFLYATSSSSSSSGGGGSTISVTSTDRLIETGVCKFLNGIVPYEFHSITFNNNVTHYYVEFLPTSTNFTFLSTAVTLANVCPNPGPSFRLVPFSFYECTLDLTGTTFGLTPAQINSRFNYGLDTTTFNVTTQLQYNVPSNVVYTGALSANKPNCLPQTARIEPRSLFSTNVDGFQLSTDPYSSANVSSVRIVERIRVLLPYINM